MDLQNKCDVCGREAGNLIPEVGNLYGKIGQHNICLSCWYTREYAPDPFAEDFFTYDPWEDIYYKKNKQN